MNHRTAIFGTILIVISTALAVPPTSAQNGFFWANVKPEKVVEQQKVSVLGKTLTYSVIETGKEVEVAVEGPTTLRALVRVEFEAGVTGEKRYYLRYTRDGENKGNFRRNSAIDVGTHLIDSPAIHLSQPRYFYFKVPPGKHIYRFYVGSKAAYSLYLRFYRRTAEMVNKPTQVSFTPSQFTKVVPLAVNETTTTYYRISPQDSLHVAVIGPTTIQAMARLEFDSTMVFAQRFRLRVYEDQRVKQTFSLRSQPSDVTAYREVSDKIAGDAAKFYIEVPRGKHIYRFDLPGDNRSVLLHFYIPKKDLTNNL